jgi:RHS repeat-associated protein
MNKKLKVTVYFQVLIIILLTASFNFAQTTGVNGYTPVGLAPGSPAGSSQISNLDNINYYNGNLNFRVPLINVGGRGSTEVPISLKIDRTWAVSTFNATASPGGYPNYQHTPNPEPWTETSGYNPGFLTVQSVGYNPQACSEQGPPPTWAYASTLTRFTFTSADGTRYELRDTQTDGQPRQGGLPCYPNFSGVSRGTIFSTKDGTSVTYLSDTPVKENDQASLIPDTTGYLKFANGDTYRIVNGKVSWISDINGNKTTFTYGGVYGAALETITDSLGRVVTFYYGVNDVAPYGLCDKIVYKGFNGEERTIRISYRLLNEVLRSGYSILSSQALFGYGGSNDYPLANLTVPAAVWLPNGQSYQFKYNDYAELARVDLPSGGAFEYDHIPESSDTQSHGGFSDLTSAAFIYRQVSTKRTYRENGTLENTLKLTGNWNERTVTSTASNNAILSKTKHYFYGDLAGGLINAALSGPSYSPWNEGKEYKTEAFAADGQTILSRVEHTWQQRAAVWWASSNNSPANDPRITETKTTLLDVSPNLVSKKTFSYDGFNNVTDIYEYDYGNDGSGQAGAFKRRTHTEYLTTNLSQNNASYIGNDVHLKRLPKETWVSSDIDGSNKVSLTQYEYDNYSGTNHAQLLNRTNVVGHDSVLYSTTNMKRGNVTAVTSYATVTGQTASDPIITYSQYDILGNIVETIDGRGYHSTINYDDNFGSPDGESRTNSAPTQLNGQSTFGFPKSGTNTLGWIVGYSQFDYYLGSIVNTEDINGIISKTFYNDFLDRPTKTVEAVGTNYESQSNIIYDDVNRRVETKSDLFVLNDNKLKTESFYDGLGRTIESRRYEADGNFIVTKSVPFVMVQDSESSLWRAGIKTSNPYRPNSGEQPVWTTALSDSLGRRIKTITPDGATIKTDFSGSIATVTDQAGKKGRIATNALGQLIRVDEPNDQGQLDASGSPVQSTSYDYNTLGNLTTVLQGTQTRTYLYDSLSRLKQSTNPELGNIENGVYVNGTINFQYDNNGNLTQKTDAKGVQTTFTYDALNRILTRSYSAPANLANYQVTPNVTYSYDDAAVPFSKGKMTKVSSSVSESRYTVFDNIGNILSSQQVTDGQTYNFAYTYNLSGGLVEQTYPSGRVVKNTLNNNGELSMVQSKKNQNYGFHTYASSFTYTTAGNISSMQLGNGRWESAKFNTRLQAYEIGLGNTQDITATKLWQVNYEYGELNTDGTINQTKNNGNITRQTLAVPATNGNSGFSAIQTYAYDSLNRLQSAEETIGGGQTWKQVYKFDKYGNRNFVEANTTTLPKGCFEDNLPSVCLNDKKVLNPAVEESNNRLKTAHGYEYDKSGNVIKDADNRSFTYDALNRQVFVKDANNQTLGNYFYDGDGKRIKKTGNTENTVFVYDAFGSLAAEYSIGNEQPNPTPQTSYLTTDILGSPRIVTDQNGQVISRRDFLPYGEEINANESNRKQALGYNYGDKTRQKYTGYEKDSETKLDFAQNRYYATKHGRFTSVDPVMASASIFDPQSFNRFVYVKNNPLNLTDSLGLWDDGCDPQVKPCSVTPSPATKLPIPTSDACPNCTVTVKTHDFYVEHPTNFIEQYTNALKKGFSIFWQKGIVKTWTQSVPDFLGFDRGGWNPTPTAPPKTSAPPRSGSPDSPSTGGSDTGNAKVFLAWLAWQAIQQHLKESQENARINTVRRFVSREEYRTATRTGIAYDPEYGPNGIPATTPNYMPRNQAEARRRTGAASAEYWMDFDVRGLRRGPTTNTKGGLPEYRIKADLTPDRIKGSGRVRN